MTIDVVISLIDKQEDIKPPTDGHKLKLAKTWGSCRLLIWNRLLCLSICLYLGQRKSMNDQNILRLA